MTDPTLQSIGDPSAARADGEPAYSSVVVHRVRWHTGLSQAEFARTYRIDPEQLRQLEEGVIEADSALLAYLRVIDRAPEAVRAALHAS